MVVVTMITEADKAQSTRTQSLSEWAQNLWASAHQMKLLEKSFYLPHVLLNVNNMGAMVERL